ncbi:hypothetical protein ABFS82_03G107600 [Erythranthe guttata]|uniref:F-box domain-containing protein n=1 Tax=Erythranthe guttata TaxID=4155 RepID=A0A022Q4F6_ERYGU|nr:PREDICTED: F-box/kelch-repeat protein At3g06240-like [Erythranthe guttata]EYU22876.1 hypothetical protein MIMGU_mgv1a018584mg [Erythranthe guttata]|eukprot:XP_012854725.1 PREDICTED: F-box/kelch-repeat protein At3g06240-like [Erythranthe guttata]
MKSAKQKTPKKEVEFLKNLPSEIVIEILSRLPLRTIGICRRVRKSWRDLIQTLDFANFYLPRSVSGLVTCFDFDSYHVFAFEDELDLEDPDRNYDSLTSFDCSGLGLSICDLRGSVNGLLFMHPLSSISSDYYICNPITREYIKFPYEQRLLEEDFKGTVNYGFGVSNVSGQYKVVKIVHVRKSICHVYTLGTGKWRRIACGARLGRNDYSNGAFINGCLHWFLQDYESSGLISCFDLETETFSTFSHPPLLWRRHSPNLVALGDCLCICDNTDDEIDFWVMKEYGNEKSWTKQFVIRKDYGHCYGEQPRGTVYPIKLFKDGHVLMTWQRDYSWFYDMFYYSNKTKITQKNRKLMTRVASPMQAMLYTPSFLSLKTFPRENVTKFFWFR